MIKQVDIIFWVEHKDRELDSYKEVSTMLKEKYGLSSLIISNFFHSYYLWFYKAKVYVFNNLTNNVGWPDGFLWETYANEAIYISHRWEQNLFPINYKFKAPYNDFEKQNVKLFAWDESFKEYLSSYGVNEKNIKVVGNISNNILYKVMHQQNKIREDLSSEFKLDKNRKWLFLPMNFNWAFITQEAMQSRIRGGYDEGIAYEYNYYSKKCLKEFILLIDEISKKYLFEIILRPHPSITEDQYLNVFTNILGYIPDNLIINKSYSIREWVVASDIIGSSWSTSVWDSYQIGKKCFYYTPYERPEWLNTYWLDAVTNIKKFEEFESFLDVKVTFDKKQQNYDSIERFSRALVELLPEDQPKIKKITFKYIKNLPKFFVKNMLCKYFKCIYIQKWQTYDWFDVIKIK